MIAEANPIDTVLNVVLSWPRERQLSLARRVLDHLDESLVRTVVTSGTVQPIITVEQIRQMLAAPDAGLNVAPSLEELEGILATDEPPPTDEQVQDWLEEERMRKYG